MKKEIDIECSTCKVPLIVEQFNKGWVVYCPNGVDPKFLEGYPTKEEAIVKYKATRTFLKEIMGGDW
jgi:hypothetical protein